MGDARRRLGAEGEELAARFLTERGMRLVGQGFRCRLGEVDLIAWDGSVLVFCEVKTRRSARCGTPEEAVTRRKQQRLRLLAEAFMAARRLTGAAVRFDVIAVRVSAEDGEPSVRHIPAAF